MSQYRRTGFTPNSVTFTNPSDFSDTAKASVERKQKNIGQQKLTNASTLIKLNRRVSVADSHEGEACCVVPLYEDLSMSFSSSGSVQNAALLVQMKKDLLAAIELWFEDLTTGFVPLDKAPTFPAP